MESTYRQTECSIVHDEMLEILIFVHFVPFKIVLYRDICWSHFAHEEHKTGSFPIWFDPQHKNWMLEQYFYINCDVFEQQCDFQMSNCSHRDSQWFNKGSKTRKIFVISLILVPSVSASAFKPSIFSFQLNASTQVKCGLFGQTFPTAMEFRVLIEMSFTNKKFVFLMWKNQSEFLLWIKRITSVIPTFPNNI